MRVIEVIKLYREGERASTFDEQMQGIRRQNKTGREEAG
jgi:hypothetical protein